MKILVSINYVHYSDEHKKQSQDTALSVLVKNKRKSVILASINFPDETVNIPPVFHILPMLQNDSQKKIGNSRRMPYIKEIFDICSNMPGDVFGYMNSDILVKKDFFDIFKQNADAYVFYKKDIEKVGAEDFAEGKMKVVNEFPHGQDAFFFKKEWWLSNRNLFPDGLVVGETEFDTCYNSIIQEVVKNYVLSRSLYHIQHERIWNIDSRGGINNKLIWDNVKEKYGIPKFTPETRQL